MALFGTAGGVGLGLFLGWALVRALADEGFSTFAVPVTSLAVVLARGRRGRRAGGRPPGPAGRPHGRVGGHRHGLTVSRFPPPVGAPVSSPRTGAPAAPAALLARRGRAGYQLPPPPPPAPPPTDPPPKPPPPKPPPLPLDDGAVAVLVVDASRNGAM